MEEQKINTNNEEQDAKPENREEEQAEEIISWMVPEHNTYERGRNWHIIFSIAIGALLLYGLFSQNFLFAVIIIIAGLTILFHNNEEAPMIKFALTDEGIILGKKFYDYDEFKNFGIVYKPSQGIKNLYIEFKSGITPRLSIPLNDINPLPLRKTLSSYVEEDKERIEPPISEEIARFLKI
jgi:hypothetical protein